MNTEEKESKVKYNGNHYFSGDVVKGIYSQENGKHYIVHVLEDEFGNEFETKLEVIKPEATDKLTTGRE